MTETIEIVEHVKSIAGVTMTHWFLAYASLLGKIFLDMSRVDGPVKEVFNTKNIFRTLASIIFVPVLMILCTSTELKTMLPINHLTAFFVGFQTEALLYIVSKMGKTKKDENS